jgi:hypothetical protein
VLQPTPNGGAAELPRKAVEYLTYSVIVVTEVGLLPPNERWRKLILPLQEQLVGSGLGRVLDFETLQRRPPMSGTA